MRAINATFLIVFVVIVVVFRQLIVCLKYYDLLKCFLLYQVENSPRRYDYIVVGSGSAGSVVAHRLSQDSKQSVLLLEAGPQIGSLIDIPAVQPALLQSEIDWQYETVPQRHGCFGLRNNISKWPMGKVTGGTSRMNNMIYLKGNSADYRSWFDGIDGFNYELDVEYYFKKATESTDAPYRIENSVFTTKLGYFVLNALESLGFSIGDMNGDSDAEFMVPSVNTLNGARHSTFHSLLHQQAPRHNLYIKSNALVTRILFKQNYEAYGVTYHRLGKMHRVFARKAIILCAGVIGTPKILMLSGIGHRDHLHAVGIPCINQLPVGDNLQDHVTTGLDLVMVAAKSNVHLDPIALTSLWSAADYFINGRGSWTAIGCEVVGMINAHLGLMIIPAGLSADSSWVLRENFGVSDRSWYGYFSAVTNASASDKRAISMLPIVLRPYSRGTVRLKDGDPFSRPLIDPNYLADSRDVDTLAAGIEFVVNKLLRTREMRDALGAVINANKIGGCEGFAFDTREYWRCYVRHLTFSTFHPAGTCKMGGKNDASAVVDTKFRVKNTNKLYVADASVFPNLPGANINAAVVMMAEKAVDSIKRNQFDISNFCSDRELFVSQGAR